MVNPEIRWILVRSRLSSAFIDEFILEYFRPIIRNMYEIEAAKLFATILSNELLFPIPFAYVP